MQALKIWSIANSDWMLENGSDNSTGLKEIAMFTSTQSSALPQGDQPTQNAQDDGREHQMFDASLKGDGLISIWK